MSTGVETAELIEPWLYSVLSGDTALAALVGGEIYGPLTPDEIVGPYITMAPLSPRDIRGIGVARIMVEAIYMIKVVAQTASQDDCLPAFKRVCELIDGVSNASYNGGQITCVRESVISYAETAHSPTGINSVPFYNLGGNFRIRAST